MRQWQIENNDIIALYYCRHRKYSCSADDKAGVKCGRTSENAFMSLHWLMSSAINHLTRQQMPGIIEASGIVSTPVGIWIEKYFTVRGIE